MATDTDQQAAVLCLKLNVETLESEAFLAALDPKVPTFSPAAGNGIFNIGPDTDMTEFWNLLVEDDSPSVGARESDSVP